MSDGSFPHTVPESDPDDAEQAASKGGRVLDFPGDDKSNAGQPVPAGTWADEGGSAETTHSRPGIAKRGELVAFPRGPSTERRLRAQPPVSEAVRAAAGQPETRLAQAAPAETAPAETAPAETALAETTETTRPETALPETETVSTARGEMDASGPRPTHSLRNREDETAARPRYLASELLREDRTPGAPLRRSLRWGGAVIGTVGAVGVVTFGGVGSVALGLAGLFALCAVMGLAPVNARVRGASLAVAGTVGAGWAAALSAQSGGDPAAPLLVACTIISVSALCFRASHRSCRFARSLAMVGLCATAAWLVLTGGVDALVVDTLDWQSWLGPLSRVLLIGLLLSGALTFLDPTGPGGAWAVATGLLVWLALYAGGSIALAAWPPGHLVEVDLADPRWLSIAAPLFAALAAGGLCQVWVMISGRARGGHAGTSGAS